MPLSAPQRKQLSSALLSAFPREIDLARMVAFGFDDITLAQVAGSGPLNDVVFNLLGWAKAHGRENDLIAQAYAQNSTNPELRAFVEEVRPQLDQIRQEQERAVASHVHDSADLTQVLAAYANLYESTRQTERPSFARTTKFGRLVAQSRNLAPKLSELPLIIHKAFASNSEGQRIVAIALIQGQPEAAYFGYAEWAIYGSRSPFEQYQALLAAEAMLPGLEKAQREHLLQVLDDQRSGQPGKLIKSGSDRWALSNRILRAIGGKTP